MPTNASNSNKRVAITGMGIVSALGIDEDSVWSRLLEGKSGIDHLQSLDTSKLKVGIGAEVPPGLVEDALKPLGRRPTDRALDMAIVASAQALFQAKLISGSGPFDNQDVSVIVGTGTGSAQSHNQAYNILFEKGSHNLRPTTVPRCMYNAISAGVSLQFRLTGTNYVIVSACTSATNAIGTAFRMIRHGYADRVLCGGADGFFDPFSFGAWNNIGALSRIEDPQKACRPFAEDRQGTVLGEGAGAIVLEAYDRAVERGASIRAEVLGYGESSDATHITKPSSEGQAKAIQQALKDACVDPSDIALINAHGTATPGNDFCESESIRSVFGDQADRVPVVANKSYFGHTLGASGVLETIASVKMIENRQAPPNLNLENPDPVCDLNLVKSEPVSIDTGAIMKNSFGFGGGNGVLIIGPDRA